jgi:hypothetical protein
MHRKQRFFTIPVAMTRFAPCVLVSVPWSLGAGVKMCKFRALGGHPEALWSIMAALKARTASAIGTANLGACETAIPSGMSVVYVAIGPSP